MAVESDNTTLPVAVLARDLLMGSRVTSAGRRLGVEVSLVRDPAALEGLQARLLIADLDLEDAIDRAAEWSSRTGRPVAGFVQHVHTDRIRAARAAGIDPIIPRGRLEAVLPDLLSKL